MSENLNLLMTQFPPYFTPIKKKSTLQAHPLFPLLVDCFIRKGSHHAVLHGSVPSTGMQSFLQSFLHYLTQSCVPHYLRHAQAVYIDIEKMNEPSFENEITNLQQQLDSLDHALILVVNEGTRLLGATCDPPMTILLTHPKCRLLVLSQSKLQNSPHFQVLQWAQLTDAEMLCVMSEQCKELESFHGVVIPAEVITKTYLLAKRYLKPQDPLSNALLLIDTSAAREHAMKEPNASKAFLMIETVLDSLSQWINIPSAYLDPHHFNFANATHTLKQHLFGQEIAVQHIAQTLQQYFDSRTYTEKNFACLSRPLETKKTPLAFLFVGPSQSGKKTAALSLVDQLFNQRKVFYFKNFALDHSSGLTKTNALLDIPFHTYDHSAYLTLKEVICERPYAVLLFENIEKAPLLLLQELQELLLFGYLYDAEGHKIHFSEAMVILTTTMGSKQLSELAAAPHHAHEEKDEMDLVSLVMGDEMSDSMIEHYSLQEIIEKILPALSWLPMAIFDALRIIPFMPLTQRVFEKIIRFKLQDLQSQLDTQRIELTYGLEVIQYISNKILLKPNSLNQNLRALYLTIEQALIKQDNNNELFLHLDESGLLLRCDWINRSVIRQHA